MNNSNTVDLSYSSYDPTTKWSCFMGMENGQLVRQMSPTVRLFEAVENNDLDFARQALADGADVNARDRDHSATPLHRAALAAKHSLDENVAMCSLLKEHGADLDATDGTLGWTAQTMAREQGAENLARALAYRLIEAFVS